MAVNMQGAAQGAAIGTAVMPGIGTAVGAIAGAFLGGSSGGGGASGAAGGPVATPQASQAAAFGSGLDGSGWIINFGNGNTTDLNNAQDKTIRSTGPTADATASQSPYLPGAYGQQSGMFSDALGFGIPPVVWMAVFGIAAWRLYSSKK